MAAMQPGPHMSTLRPPFGVEEIAPLVADLFADALPPQRVQLLNGLLSGVGPLALVGIAAGAFSSLLPPTRWHVASASLDDAMRLTAGEVLDLARYVEQKCPESFAELPRMLRDGALRAASCAGLQ